MSLTKHYLRMTPPVGATVHQTLAAWGIESCRVKRQSGGEDELQLAFAGSITGATLIDPGSTIELFDGLGVRRFFGYALRPRRSVSGAQHRHVIRVLGPHFWLARVTHVQAWTYSTDPADADAPTATSDISSVVMHRADPDTGARVSLRAQIHDVLTDAVALGCPVAWDFDHFPELYLPEQQRRIATPWQLLRDMMQFLPHVTMGWDYTGQAGTDPILRFSATRGGEIQSHWPERALHLDLISNQNVSVEPRDDLLVKTVRVHYVRQHVREQEGQRPVTMRHITTKTSNAVAGEDGYDWFGSADIVFELRGATFNNGELTQAPELVPPDSTSGGPLHLAEALHEAFVHLWHQVAGTIVLQSTAWSWNIGQRAVPVGFGNELNDARLVVVSVENDVAAGTVAIQCGPPGRLLHGTIFDLVKASREFSMPDKEDQDEEEVPDGETSERPEAVVRETLYHSHGGVLFTGEFDVINDAQV